jgi:outer membrane protein assembly factor BamB
VTFLRDDNGDSVVGIGDRPMVVFTTYRSGICGHIVAVDAATGEEAWDYTCAGPSVFLAAGDVDGDGRPEVIGGTVDGEIVCLDGDGAVEWTTPFDPDVDQVSMPYLADLDGDSRPEILQNGRVLDGATGTVVVDAQEHVDIETRTLEPIAADLDGDGEQELLVGSAVLDARGTLLWDVARVTGWVRVVQRDADAEGEIFWGGRAGYKDHDGRSAGSFPDVPGENGGCIGDLDGDGDLDLAATREGEAVRAWDLDGTLLWENFELIPALEGSCSVFDLDGDGAMEVIQQAGLTFAILDGRTGTVLWSDADPEVNFNSGVYPTVADVDYDGHAEIFVTSEDAPWGPLAAFEHDGSGWSGAGPTWPVHHYAETNIDDDGHIPAFPTPWWLAKGYVHGRTAYPRPSAADLRVEFTDLCDFEDGSGSMVATVQVSNPGLASLGEGTQLALYTLDEPPRLLVTTTLPGLPAGWATEGTVLEFSLGDEPFRGVRAVVDDDGTGVGTVIECDETNNAAEATEAR